MSKGQTFEAAIPAISSHCEDLDLYLSYDLGPRGSWKDHYLFDFFKYGTFHPSSCCAIWCTSLLMGQVMVRARLNMLGHALHNTSGGMNHAFKYVAAIYGFYVMITVGLEIVDPTPPAGQEDEYDYPESIRALKTLLDILFSIYSIYALMKTREAVRNKYNIGSSTMVGTKCGTNFEDFVCAACCSCCTVAQLSRQVNVYEEYNAVCCSETGVPDNVPTLI